MDDFLYERVFILQGKSMEVRLSNLVAAKGMQLQVFIFNVIYRSDQRCRADITRTSWNR